MAKQTKPRYLLLERGRYFYQRKVPQHLHEVLGIKKWHAPLGDDFDEACERLRALRDEHDGLIEQLNDEEFRRDTKIDTRRRRDREQARRMADEDAAYEKWLQLHGLKSEEEEYLAAYGEVDEPVWEDAERWLKALDYERGDKLPSVEEVEVLTEFLTKIEAGTPDAPAYTMNLPPFPEYTSLVRSFSPATRTRVIFHERLPVPMDDDEYFDHLTGIYARLFGEGVVPPLDPDDRDKFEFAKLTFERRISRVARNPNTVSRVAERYLNFVGLKPRTENKYRRTIKRFIESIRDLPVNQITPRQVRDYRDELRDRGLTAASIRAEFTPVSGLFAFACDEELIDVDPTAGVRLPKERRAVEETKWLPFEPHEMERILAAVEDIWGQDVRGLTIERRQALQMSVRVLSYTAMRPSELLALRPDQVDHRSIKVEGGKTKSSWRVIPLHPAISDFPEWMETIGFRAFNSSKTGAEQSDQTTVLRHNFIQLLRSKLEPPIQDSRKTLYSLRSSFQNAMRRAGAPKDVRRAILGHVESGAIRHYDDGPEFNLLRRWVERTDPRS